MTGLNPAISDKRVPVPTGRLLVIGCGSIGKRHLENLLQLGIADVAAFDVRDERRQEVEERYGVPVFSDLAVALEGGVRAALICSPTHLHPTHALAAAKAGCHLFVEKPISDTLEGLEELQREVDRRGLVTLVGCNFRFHPGLRHVKSLLDEGAIGTVISARVQFGQYLPDWHPWEDYRQGYSARQAMGGGVILDRIHEIDYLCWLLGEVTEVCSMVGRLSRLEIDTEDTAEILVRFAGGAFGSIHLDYVRRTYDCSLEVVGDAGTIQWRYQDHLIRWYRADQGTWSSLQWPRYEGNTMYLDEIKHFLRALAGMEESVQDIRAARRVLEIALAAKESASSGRRIRLQL